MADTTYQYFRHVMRSGPMYLEDPTLYNTCTGQQGVFEFLLREVLRELPPGRYEVVTSCKVAHGIVDKVKRSVHQSKKEERCTVYGRFMKTSVGHA